MKNEVAGIKDFVSPPSFPIDTEDNGTLRILESILSLSLPKDYVEFGGLYGSGELCISGASWEIWSPFRRTFHATILNFARIWNEYRSAVANNVALKIYPEVGGILPFAINANGGWVCWLTIDSPNQWPVIELDTLEADGYLQHNLNFSQFFLKIFKGKLRPLGTSTWDDWDPKKNISFKPRVFHDKKYV